MPQITEAIFRGMLQSKLGGEWERARQVFENYGKNLAFDVVNVLLHAVDQNKTQEVLGILEVHWDEHLKYQHPGIRGTVSNNFGTNPTEQIFLKICQQTLGLRPNS